MHYKIAEDILWKYVDDEVVIVNMAEDQYFFLNDRGADIWGLINEGLKEDDIVGSLCEEYDAEKDVIAKDVRKIIEELLVKNIISKE